MMAGDLSVAVVGGASLVGRELVTLLLERRFPIRQLRLLGTVRSAGQTIEEEGWKEPVELLGPGVFTDTDVVFFAAGPAVAGEFAPVAVDAGAAVVDCSSRFRLDEMVPLVVPEVNADRITTSLIACPSATAVALSVVLAPLAAAVGLRRVVVSTYQGVATAGRRGIDGLSRETLDLLNGRGFRTTRFARRIAFNCIPEVGALEPGGMSTHELHAVEETRRVLDDPSLALHVTAVRVPVFVGSAYSVHVETEQPLDGARATALLREAPGLVVSDATDEAYVTPAELVGSEATHVGRVRDDPTGDGHGLALWVVLDGLRKGSALNAIQIAEIVAREHL